MISILSHSPEYLDKEKIKLWLKKIIKKPRGPQVVLNNLILGLKRIDYNFLINKISTDTKKIHVISSVSALRWAIKEKEKGKISELIAGPNIVMTPLDDNAIITNKNIDKILLPSEWTAEYFSTLKPSLKDKIYIWPAGSECNIKITNRKRDICLIFKKYTEERLFEDIKKYLEEEHILYEVVEYGKYESKEYFSILEKTKFLIYLQEAESQGMALQEAWAYDVPTFVWNKGFVTCPYTGIKIYGKTAAPYLTEENGEFFKDFDEFKQKMPIFIKNLSDFKPAEYCKNNLSIEKSTEIYANIIENKQEPWYKSLNKRK